MLNLSASSLQIFLIVTTLEFPTVNQFLTTNIMPHEIKNDKKAEKYLFAVFTMSIAQFLLIIFTFTSYIFAEEIACF